ncbi:anti-sigma-D factor RsdA [Actinopolyspora halophila]|uniref:anti-sigma-D factor RsdA n=1 Tax=Actinopolyspora halophila TaxID=1850 RepID=UPI00037A329A|nr:anti-sigma-D factor RsdA [Actinopolyspora halophila]
MAEDRGSGGDDNGRDSVEPGQQDDRLNVEEGGTSSLSPVGGDSESDDRFSRPEADSEDSGSGGTGGTETTSSGGAESTTPERGTVEGPVPGDSEGAEVLEFRPREDTADGAGAPGERGADPAETDLDEALDLTEDLDEDEDPLDLAQLRADDELLNTLGGTESGSESFSDESGVDVEALLLAWRRDVDSAPVGELVDTDSAVAAVEEGKPKRRARKRRHLVPVATAAAVLMITFTGVGLAARDAGPGDALWSVTQVLYSDRAASAAAASRAETQLEHASNAWQQGQEQAAETALQQAEQQFSTIDPGERRSELRAAHASLSAKFQQPPTPPESSSTESSGSDQQGPPPSDSSEESSESTTSPSSEPTSPPTSSSVPSSTSKQPPTSSSGESSSTGSESPSSDGGFSGSSSDDSTSSSFD